MIVPIIMAIWFGIAANKARRNVIGWALGGALLTFIVATILANIGILLVTGELGGRIEFDTYMAIRIITGIATIIVMGFAAGRLTRFGDAKHEFDQKVGELREVVIKNWRVIPSAEIGFLIPPLLEHLKAHGSPDRPIEFQIPDGAPAAVGRPIRVSIPAPKIYQNPGLVVFDALTLTADGYERHFGKICLADGCLYEKATGQGDDAEASQHRRDTLRPETKE